MSAYPPSLPVGKEISHGSFPPSLDQSLFSRKRDKVTGTILPSWIRM